MNLEEQVADLADQLSNVHPSKGPFVRRDKVIAALRAMLECQCDVDYRCGNHDTEAEAAAAFAEYRRDNRTAPVDESLAYDRGDPKAFEL